MKIMVCPQKWDILGILKFQANLSISSLHELLLITQESQT